MDRFGLAAVLLLTAGIEWMVLGGGDPIGTEIGGPRALAVALPLLIAMPLLWRRRRPMAACGLTMAGLVATGVVSGSSAEGTPIIAAMVIAPFSVALYGPRSGLAVVVAGFTAYALLDDNITSGRVEDLWAGAFFGLLMLGAWLAGATVRSRRDSAALAARAAELEQRARAAAADERARVARELHDIVSHNLSAVVVQAAGARAQANGSDPGALEKIERSGREALVEMRRLLGVLREDESEGPALGPQPGIDQLPELVSRVRAAGIEVDLQVEGDRTGLEPAVDLSGYRIVQEALTNVFKHAGPAARAEVHVRCAPDALTITVTDDGAGRPPAETPEAGHGLVGMRERVALFGGELHAGPRANGGFAVTARLPAGAAR